MPSYLRPTDTRAFLSPVFRTKKQRLRIPQISHHAAGDKCLHRNRYPQIRPLSKVFHERDVLVRNKDTAYSNKKRTIHHKMSGALQMDRQLLYVELKTGYSDDGPAWIGYVGRSKSGKTLYFNDHAFLC